jgi:hypothetical protein
MKAAPIMLRKLTNLIRRTRLIILSFGIPPLELARPIQTLEIGLSFEIQTLMMVALTGFRTTLFTWALLESQPMFTLVFNHLGLMSSRLSNLLAIEGREERLN